ncbi:MAG: hypothetical protein AAF502_03660 [Bacteroidota bacterium]
MENVSSSSTLFLKFFFPTIWIVFFGTITLFLFLQTGVDTADVVRPSASKVAKLGMLTIFILGILFLYYFFMRLKRVDMDEHFIYVTNYFKVYKYPYSNISHIEKQRFLLWRPTRIYFVEAGSFGNHITFLASKYFWQFLAEHPDIGSKFVVKGEV